MKRQRLSFLARAAMMLLLTMLTSVSAWADWGGGTYTATTNETINTGISVNADATLTINSGVTITVNGGIVVADGKTLTITGSGTLKVYGINGDEGAVTEPGCGDGNSGSQGNGAIVGNVIINGATVEATGGSGGMGGSGGDGVVEGDPGGDGGDGGAGGAAFTGQVTMISGTITANGGTGGTGGLGGPGPGGNGSAGDGGDGGNAFSGSLILYGGKVFAQGGDGGNGETPGNYSYAFSQNVTFKAASYTMTGDNNPLTDNATGYQKVDITADDASFIVNNGYCGTSGNESDVTWSLNILGQLTISGTGAMADYKKYQTPWDQYYESLTSVVIEDGVTSIGECAFYELVNVTTISLGSDVTTIGKSAFQLCRGLTSVIIPNNVTNIDEHAFDGCKNLETVSFGSGVTKIGSWAFQDCKNLTTISFGSGLTNILQGAFQGCTSLSSVNLPASLKSIGSDAFKNCNSQATVTLNSNPNIARGNTPAFDNNTTIKMNLTATIGANGEYWMTFYNKNFNFQVPATGTKIFKAALSEDKLTIRELTTDKIVTKNKPVILKSETASITLTRTTSDSSNDFDNDNSLTGVESSIGKEVTDDPSTTYALNSGAQGVGFYKVATGSTLGVGNAYVTSTSTSDFLPLAVVTSGYCGDTSNNGGADVTWNYDTTTKTLTISGTGPMMYYGSALDSDSKYHSTAPWSHLDSEIEKVIVGDGVTYIGSYAFAYCAALTTISLPASVVALGDYVCFTSNVTRIDIPSMTAATLGTDGFEYCLPGLQIAVPADLLKTYQTATNWSTYAGKLVGVLSETTGFATDFATGNYEYTRTFKYGVASTVCLPFSIDDTQAAAAGKFYTFAGIDKSSEKWEVIMEEAINKVSTDLTAHTPYLFVPAATGTVLFHGTALANVSAGTANSGDWTFTGTYARKQWDDTNNTDEIGSIYGFAAISGTSTDGQNTAINAGSFFRVAGGANSYIVPFRAYMKYTATNAPSMNHAAASDDLPAKMTVRLVGSNGETTAIGTLDTRTGLLSFDNEAWYTLDGRKLDSKPTQKGIYINGGRKVVVR